MLLSVFVRVNAGGGYFTSTPLSTTLHVRKVTDVTARIRTWASHFPGECANHYTTVTAQRAESDLCEASL